MDKTPDEIKKGLECCAAEWAECEECTYCDGCVMRGGNENLDADALAYITQIENAVEFYSNTTQVLDAKIAKLESRLAQVERERDAAEHDLHLLADGEGACNVCARFDEGYIPTPPHCRYACDDDCFRWRGVCAENSEGKCCDD